MHCIVGIGARSCAFVTSIDMEMGIRTEWKLVVCLIRFLLLAAGSGDVSGVGNFS